MNKPYFAIDIDEEQKQVDSRVKVAPIIVREKARDLSAWIEKVSVIGEVTIKFN
jgi:hypothetical protein